MTAFLLRRLLHAIFVVWGVVTVVFFLVRLTGDPVAVMSAGLGHIDERWRTCAGSP